MNSSNVSKAFRMIGVALLCSCASNATRTAAESPTFSSAEVLSWVTYGPHPQYPLEARRLRLSGSGVFILRIQISSGRVKEVTVSHSTGWAILDAAAINTLRQWRLKPGVAPPIKVILPHRVDPFAAEDSLVKVPINFELSRSRN